MPTQTLEFDLIRQLRIIALLWLSYILTLVFIDHVFYLHPTFSIYYYIAQALIALLVLGIACWGWLQRALGEHLLPVVIILMATLPQIASQFLALPPYPGPNNGPEGRMLRLMPVLFIPLVLTAWKYPWRHVVLFSIGNVIFNAFLCIMSRCRSRPGPLGLPLLAPPMTVALIQTLNFLSVGSFISALMQRLHGQQASLARANQQLAQQAGTLEELTISRERNRMARELHDTLAHTLSGLSVQLEAVKAYWDVNPALAQELLAKSLRATRDGLQETRRALKSLRASPLDDLGLLLALQQVAEETAQRANVHLHLTLPEHPPALSPVVEQCLYRVAQEAVTNVAHHANAHVMELRLEHEGAVLTLTVRDDGLGFDPQRSERTGHYGLAGMNERAALAGGELHIESQPGEGTNVQLTIRQEK